MHPNQRASDIYRDFLEQQLRGENADLDALCGMHPELASELRRLSDEYRELLEILNRGGQVPSPSSPRLGSDGSASRASRGEDGSQDTEGSAGVEAKPRYEVQEQIAQGGMGSILLAWDNELRRKVAMKVALEGTSKSATTLARFVEEAQVTGQLDHPGIVPVHELGIDGDGNTYFTMRLVRGRNLKQIFELAWAEREGWSLTRALNDILKVCEAMAFAHGKGVIHRDLKPANVMVGRYGEVCVMDWGLARVLDRADHHDIRLRQDVSPLSVVQTNRQDERNDTPDSPLVTMDGDVVGTPAYMPPEQAMGKVDRIGPRADVYAVGAMLYHLLGRQPPYTPPNTKLSQRTVLLRVIDGPPKSLHQLNPDVPDELVAICEKAMARGIDDRYPDMLAMADDLRAYLENRVVKAHRTGAVVELKKWVQRNKGTAASLLAAVLILIVGLALTTTLYAEQQRQRQLAEKEARRALSLSAMKRLEELKTEAAQLWPRRPDKIETMDAWLKKSGALVAELPTYQNYLREMEAEDSREFERVWLHNNLNDLITNVGAFQVLIGDVEKRREVASTIEAKTIDEQTDAWNECAEAIAKSALYHGLALEPQIGLVPLGEDPESKLWEFWVWESGERPERDETTERWKITGETGIVLVLLPGGTFAMGSQKENPLLPNYDALANGNESPVHPVTLAPFFLSKYELTQGQWRRVTGSNPSYWKHTGGANATAGPVEQVSFEECEQILARLELVLPTEAQWEYGARGGTTTPWWTGSTKQSLQQAANLADERYRKGFTNPLAWESWDDAYDDVAPVGSFRANGFGLHDTAGNSWEWCRDWWGRYTLAVKPEDGGRMVPEKGDSYRVLRGGSFDDTAVHARSANRRDVTPEFRHDALGCRSARDIHHD